MTVLRSTPSRLLCHPESDQSTNSDFGLMRPSSTQLPDSCSRVWGMPRSIYQTWGFLPPSGAVGVLIQGVYSREGARGPSRGNRARAPARSFSDAATPTCKTKALPPTHFHRRLADTNQLINLELPPAPKPPTR